MPDANGRELNSPNFAFLAKHDPVLLRQAALAERFVFEDPSTTLVKLRQLSEKLAQLAAAHTGVEIVERESQQRLIDRLWEKKVINNELSQLLHGLRKSGNTAAHTGISERREALHQLQMARRVAIWFHQSFGNDQNFKAGKFIPPPDPAEEESSLQAELQRLRDEAQELDTKKTEAAEHARLRGEAEAEAARAYQELEAALQLAEETEQQLREERERHEQQLAKFTSQAEALPVEQLQAVTDKALAAAEEFDLSEAETRQIIDRQLRDFGWEADTETLRHSLGARPQKGKNLAIAEWPTESGPADYVLFVGLMPIAVVEAKRRNVDVAGAITQSKRYSCTFQLPEGQASPGGPWGEYHIPFLFSTNGRVTSNNSRPRAVSGFWMHVALPTTLDHWLAGTHLETLSSCSGTMSRKQRNNSKRKQRTTCRYVSISMRQFKL